MNSISIDKYEIDEEARSITFSAASSLPYERWDEKAKRPYLEVLVIDSDSVDLHRLNDGASVLWGHDTDDLLGVVEKAWIVEDKLFVRVRFSRNDEHADRVWKDIMDGVIKNVSIGYSIEHYDEKIEGNKIVRYVDRWIPYEVSIVSVPADETVGIRKMEKETKAAEGAAFIEKVDDTEGKETANVMGEVEANPTDHDQTVEKASESHQECKKECGVDVDALQSENDALKAKIKELEEQAAKPVDDEPKVEDAPNPDAEEIKACGDALGVPKDEQERAISGGMTAREFKANFRNFNINNQSTKKDKSIMKFRDYLREGNFQEKFVLNARSYDGFGGQTGEGGESLIGTETKPLVAALEKVIGVKGFRTLAGLTSNISIPVQTTRNTAYITDHLRDAATTSNPVFTPITMTPVKVSGNTRIGKELLVQANDDVEAFIVDSLTKEIAYKIEDYLLGKVAAGASGSVTYSALGAIDWDDILAFEAAVSGYALETPAYVMSPAARAALKGIAKVANYPAFLCNEANEINGYKVNVSGCVSSNDIYFGDWSKLLLGIWGQGLEILINPFTYAKEGDVEVVASICIDAAVIQGDAFVLGAVQSSSSSSASA